MNALSPITDSEELGRQLRKAKQACLRWVPASDQARSLSEELAQLTEKREFERGLRQRPRTKPALQGFVRSIAAWIADLLEHSGNEESTGYLFCGCKQSDLAGTFLTERSFRGIRATWEGLELHETVPSFFQEQKFDGDRIPSKHWATRYRASRHLLDRLESRGITLETFGEHFQRDYTAFKPVKVKARSTKRNGKKEKGKVMQLPRTAKSVRLEQQVIDLNSYLADQDFRGMMPPILCRVFNNGDDTNFRWNKGGRFHAVGVNNFQTMKSDRRGKITINGEACCEIDISASHPTLLHGLLGEPYDHWEDPYKIEEIDRWIIKKAMVAMISNGGVLRQWPRGAKAEYEKNTGRNFPNLSGGQVAEKILAKYPALGRMSKAGLDWSKLQFVESEILLAVMIRLRDQHDIPSLPVHDSLIVPASTAGICEEILCKEFETACGIRPQLKWK